jgi:hypothetical protein
VSKWQTVAFGRGCKQTALELVIWRAGDKGRPPMWYVPEGGEYRVQVRCAKVAEPKYEDLMSKVRTCSACHQNAPEGDMRTADGAWMCPSCYGVWWAVRKEGDLGEAREELPDLPTRSE